MTQRSVRARRARQQWTGRPKTQPTRVPVHRFGQPRDAREPRLPVPPAAMSPYETRYDVSNGYSMERTILRP